MTQRVVMPQPPGGHICQSHTWVGRRWSRRSPLFSSPVFLLCGPSTYKNHMYACRMPCLVLCALALCFWACVLHAGKCDYLLSVFISSCFFFFRWYTAFVLFEPASPIRWYWRLRGNVKIGQNWTIGGKPNFKSTDTPDASSSWKVVVKRRTGQQHRCAVSLLPRSAPPRPASFALCLCSCVRVFGLSAVLLANMLWCTELVWWGQWACCRTFRKAHGEQIRVSTFIHFMYIYICSLNGRARFVQTLHVDETRPCIKTDC